jgi:hypothetical protein
MYLQKIRSKKTLEKKLFFVVILQIIDEKSRIRIPNKMSRIRYTATN